MIDLNPTFSIITLNVDGLNAPINKQSLSEWIKKKKTPKTKTRVYAIYKRHILNIKKTY